MRQILRFPWKQGIRREAGSGDARPSCPQPPAWYASAATWPAHDAHGPRGQIPLARPAV